MTEAIFDGAAAPEGGVVGGGFLERSEFDAGSSAAPARSSATDGLSG